MSRVYVTNNRFRKREGELVPAVDLRPAERFGTLTAVFDHAMDPSADDDVRNARQRLKDFNDEQDYILPSGSPLATLTVGMLLRDQGVKIVQVLEWDRFDLNYHLKTVSL
jgi:hypothetical protein